MKSRMELYKEIQEKLSYQEKLEKLDMEGLIEMMGREKRRLFDAKTESDFLWSRHERTCVERRESEDRIDMIRDRILELANTMSDPQFLVGAEETRCGQG